MKNLKFAKISLDKGRIRIFFLYYYVVLYYLEQNFPNMIFEVNHCIKKDCTYVFSVQNSRIDNSKFDNSTE